MSTFSRMWNKLGDREYRSAFVVTQFKRLVPFQIRALRKNRGWSQEQLAGNSRLTQGVISRAEDSDYGNLTVNTILKIADGFDVAFIGKFVPYSELDNWFIWLSEDNLSVPSFEEEDRLFKSSGVRRVKKNRRHSRRTITKTKPRVVFINTRKEYVPHALNVPERQLSLPLTPPSEGYVAGLEEVNNTPRGRVNPALANLISNVQTGTMSRIQMGAMR